MCSVETQGSVCQRNMRCGAALTQGTSTWLHVSQEVGSGHDPLFLACLYGSPYNWLVSDYLGLLICRNEMSGLSPIRVQSYNLKNSKDVS